MHATLKRRPDSGFVKYPKEFPRRIIDGTARYRTKCDMLIGPCACGGVHQEDDGWVKDTLQANNVDIESFILQPNENGVVYCPRYWFKPLGHEKCTVLSGLCACGCRHTANEQWVLDLLQRHNAELQNCPELLLPPVGELAPLDKEILNNNNGAIAGCNCDSCQMRRIDAQRNSRLNRRDI